MQKHEIQIEVVIICIVTITKDYICNVKGVTCPIAYCFGWPAALLFGFGVTTHVL